LWRRVVTEFALGAVDDELLMQACALVDDLERLHARLAAEELVVDGSMGQPRPHPLLDDVRRHTECLSRVLSAMRPNLAAHPGESVVDPWDELARQLTAP